MIVNPFNEKETDADKLSIVDIKARDRLGRWFNIEMQMLADRYFPKRVLYYWACIYIQQLRESEPYSSLLPTISICFVNSICFPAVADHHLRFALTDDRHRLRFNDDLDLNILELPKFTKAATELSGELDAWLYFLRHADTLDLANLPPALDTPIMRRALEELNMIKQSEADREQYESRLKVQRDALTREVAAREEGVSEGIEKGIIEGRTRELADRIQFCQRLLRQPLASVDELRQRSVVELEQIARSLEQQFNIE